MKRLRGGLLTLALAFAAPAYAGCSTSDPADATKVIVCLMNKCDNTIEVTVCSTGNAGWTTYGNGVTVTNDAKGISAIHQGTHVVPRSQWKTLVITDQS